ncbi:MAG: glycosyltransferase family 1 protein [Tenuifilum sp.]|uniref:glycosyltransferase family 4 protein n=2 Tax=Tenuifilum sp. TaxID=2760880 RepID=UPI0030B6D70E
MRIAVNTRLLLKDKLEGIGWFTYETLIRITRNHPEHQFFFIFDRPYHNSFIFSNNITPLVVPPPARHPFLWYYWFEFKIPKTLKAINADVLVSPDGYISLKSDTPQVAVIHDINFYHAPQGLPFFTSHYMNYFFPRFAQKAKRVVTVSQFSRTDIANNFNIDPNKIDVAYNGASDSYKPLSESEIQLVRESISEGKPYFLFVGAFNPRKNVARLIEAYDIFRKRTGSAINLLLVGEPMFKTNDIDIAYKNCNHKNDIKFLGRKGLDELTKITGAAHAVIYPSTFEGFGIPLLEAMKCGIPIAASNVTAIPEVTGNSAIYFDPYSVDEMANAMQRVAYDAEQRGTLSANALNRQQQFSWDNTAQVLYSSIEKCF